MPVVPRWSVALAVGALLALAASRVAAAEPDGAAAHFDAGLTHYAAERFGEAAIEFFKAYQIAPHGDALYNAGLAWQSSGEPELAATAYERALDQGVHPDAVTDATSRLAGLRASLGRVEVTAPDGAVVHLPPFEFALAKVVVYLAPGDRRVAVTFASGRRVELAVTAAAGRTTTLGAEDEAPPAVPEKAPAPKSTPIPWRTVGWISVGVSAASAGTAIFLGVKAVNARDEFNDSGFTDEDAHDRAVSLMHWTNGAWATAAITGVAGAGILLFGPKGDAPVALGAGAGRVVVRGSF